MKVKSILVIASLLLSLLIGLVLARQGAGEGPDDAAGKRPVRIGLSLDTLKEARWTRDRDALVARAGELGDNTATSIPSKSMLRTRPCGVRSAGVTHSFFSAFCRPSSDPIMI